MNILFFTRALPCHITGGMELVAWDIATGLAAKGHNVKIITTRLPEGGSFEIPAGLSGRLTVIFLENTKPGRYSRGWWRYSRAAYLAERELFHPDIILSVSAGAMSVLPVLGTTPALMQAHGTLFSEIRSKLRSRSLISMVSSMRNLIAVPRDLLFYRRLKKVVAVGKEVQRALQHPFIRLMLPDDGIVTIQNGVDTDVFRPDNLEREKIRKRMGIPDGTKVLLWVSRLNRQKGAHLALEAFARLKRNDIWLLVVGDGPERERLLKQSERLGISERVVFAGRVSRDGLPAFLSASDVFVFTTVRIEGLPLNVLEAMAGDLPCVISSHLMDTLEHIRGVTGIYPVLPNDVAEIARGMLGALEHKKGRASDSSVRGLSPRSFVEKYYSLHEMINHYEELCREMAGESV